MISWLYYFAGVVLLFLQARVMIRKAMSFSWDYLGKKGFVRDIVILAFLIVFFFIEAKY
jgi:cytochrome c oxidase subunit IV